MTERQSNLYMLITLWKETEKYLHVARGLVNHRVKEKLGNAIKANNILITELERLLGVEDVEQFEEDAEIWSRVMSFIRESKPEKKQEIVILIQEYLDGNVQII